MRQSPWQMATLLCSLPESYNNLIVALESRADDLTIEFVIARLLHEERRRCEVSSDSSIAVEKALAATMERPSVQKQKSGIKKGKCFNCGKKGHFARDCRKPKKSNEKHEQQANFTETDDMNALFWGSSNTNNDECSIWYIDSGASQHMSCNKSWIKNYNEFSVPESVRLSDNRTVEALGKGSIWLRVKADGKYIQAELSEVLYVPSLAKNLFSVRAVVDKNLTVIFKDEKCTILNSNGDVMGTGKKDGKLFILDCNMVSYQSHQGHSALAETSAKLWHQRFGHLGMRNLKILRDEKLVNGLSLSDTEDMSFCEGCTKGKQKRNAFPKNEATRSSELLGIVHSDVCGPMQTASLGGNRYFVTFIDDKSRFVAVYFMKSKDHVLQKFKEYEAMVTNVTGKKIKVFRSDNGGEYNSREFNDFLVSKGIVKQRSIPRTPQQNGIAERMNRTIQESARSMLHDAELPYSFWAEAVATAVILRNRSPTVSVENETPYESFNGRKPDVSHLKVFGCDAYMHIPKEDRKKWDPKSKKCIFIGYSLHSKGYRLYDPKRKQIHESRDVIFVENEFGDRLQKKETNVQNKETPAISEQGVSIEEKAEDTEDFDDMQVYPGANENADQNDESICIPRRSNRIRNVPNRDGCITGNWWESEDSLHVYADESQEQPRTIQDALTSPVKDKWKAAVGNWPPNSRDTERFSSE